MSCYEWKYAVQLTGLTITADISYEAENPVPEEPPITISISGTQTYSDVGPPYTRRQMRCGTGFTGYYAYREQITGYGRFRLAGEISPLSFAEYYPLVVQVNEEPPTQAGIFNSGQDYAPIFPMGLFKPWKPQDPFFVCADGVWRKSTNVTKGIVRILAEDSTLLAVGYFDRIEPGASISYYQYYDAETIIGTGTMSYSIT